MLDDRARALALVPALADVTGQLEIYEALLRRWQTKINLVGPSTLSHIWTRHFADSAQLVASAPGAGAWSDFGAGAGFPGLVVALLLRAGGTAAKIQLVESDLRKAAFLREVSRETGVEAEILTARAEDVVTNRAPPQIVTSRALAPVGNLVTICASWLAAGTRGLFLTGHSDPASPIPTNLCAIRTKSLTGSGFVVTVARRDAEQH